MEKSKNILFIYFFFTTNGFASNHDRSLQIYFYHVKHWAKPDFLKDVERRVVKRVFFFFFFFFFFVVVVMFVFILTPATWMCGNVFGRRRNSRIIYD